MNNTYTKYILFIVAILGFIFIVESNRKLPINWNASYETSSKQPLGLYILNNELDSLVGKNTKITRTQLPEYEIYDELQDSIASLSNVLIINQHINDNYSLVPNILQTAKKGNDIFLIGALGYYSDLLDTLGIAYAVAPDRYDYENDSVTLSLTNPKLNNYNFQFSHSEHSAIFIPDSLRSTVEVLGYKTIKNTKYPVFIRVPFYKGNIYLHTEPSAFTNVNILASNNHLYVEGVMSYLNDSPTLFKVDRKTDTNNPLNSDSMLRYILTNDSLKWAWYLILISLVLFSLFQAKRKQRIIPIIRPLENTTIQFTRTVSGLYISHKDYKNIMLKSIVYTLEKIRRVYFIDTTNLDELFIENYHKKTGKDIDDIRRYVKYVSQIRNNPDLLATQANLITLNKLTEKIID